MAAAAIFKNGKITIFRPQFEQFLRDLFRRDDAVCLEVTWRL